MTVHLDPGFALSARRRLRNSWRRSKGRSAIRRPRARRASQNDGALDLSAPSHTNTPSLRGSRLPAAALLVALPAGTLESARYFAAGETGRRPGPSRAPLRFAGRRNREGKFPGSVWGLGAGGGL